MLQTGKLIAHTKGDTEKQREVEITYLRTLCRSLIIWEMKMQLPPVVDLFLL